MKPTTRPRKGPRIRHESQYYVLIRRTLISQPEYFARIIFVSLAKQLPSYIVDRCEQLVKVKTAGCLRPPQTTRSYPCAPHPDCHVFMFPSHTLQRLQTWEVNFGVADATHVRAREELPFALRRLGITIGYNGGKEHQTHRTHDKTSEDYIHTQLQKSGRLEQRTSTATRLPQTIDNSKRKIIKKHCTVYWAKHQGQPSTHWAK